MSQITVQWLGGGWVLTHDGTTQRAEGDRAWLDRWLAERGHACADLDFDGSKSLRQRFVHDFGDFGDFGDRGGRATR